ncbi:MAG: hypothetical protein OJF49_002100 [Ktedonobacterales bacterium]|jgi:hypothetical protein|nr:MAG: hypothetical protein OJF49_002100 [Ktedonobacterales bacterium]
MSRAYISAELRSQVRADANAQCGYCHSPEAFLGMPLDIEHLVPEALGGPTVRENLWLACTRCNDFKGDRTDATDPLTSQLAPLFNPRTQNWIEHFTWSLDGARIEGRTPTGRASAEALRLNNDFIVVARQFWVEAGRWPPDSDLRPAPE